MTRELSRAEHVERSIIKKYRKDLWNPFVRACKDYELIKEGDKIAVCISGGKDSMLMAKLMQQLQRISDFPFEVVYLTMNPGYNEMFRRARHSMFQYSCDSASLLHRNGAGTGFS